MINLPHNVPLLPYIMPSQNVPVQTSNNTFPTFQQPQMATQQMQTNPSIPYSTNPQDPFKLPFYQHHQADMFVANHQYQPNIISPRTAWPPLYQASPNIPPTVQTQPTYNSLPQNVLDQIRNTVSSAAPIFILPGGCHQPPNHQQSGPLNQGGMPYQLGQSTGVNTPASIYCPPSFYPYPIPMPMFDPFGAQARSKDCCSHCRKKQGGLDSRNHSLSCCCNLQEQEEHRCTATNDDTICSKRNCPGSISLQALASQLLSLPGIISCAATRLILRKVPGSNITNTMEDTMDKAQKSISTLNKDLLLVESKNAQQVNALINLHMTTNPPANIIPLLTLLQLKVNVLKAQVESLITKKVMENQGYGYEVETSGPIDPTVLSMKTNAELRQLLSALRQKECDERVNANFSPYHSQKVIAEARLNNVQAKIRQVEEEFERRRGISVPTPAPTLTSRVIQQFSESTCTFGFAKLFEPYVQGGSMDSPDPFEQSIRNPKRLCLKARKAEPEAAQQKEGSKTITTSENGTSTYKDTGTGEGAVSSVKEKGVEPKSSEDTCSCEESSSDESFDESKKKLRLRIDEKGKVTITSAGSLQDASLLKLAPNIVTKIKKTPAENGEGEEKPEEKKRVSIETEVTKEEDKETRDEDSGVQPLDIKEEDVDKEFEIITISDDDDEGTEIETFDSEKSKVKEEPISDPDVEKKTDVEAERESKEHVKTIKKELESKEKMKISDREDIPIKKEPEEDDQKPSHYTTTMTLNVKPIKKTTRLHFEPKIETKKSSDYATVPVKGEPEEDKKIHEKPSHYTTTATMRIEPKAEPTFEYVAPIAKVVPETIRTLDRSHISVKEEPEDKKPMYYTKLTSIPKPKKVVPHFFKPKVKAEVEAPVDAPVIEKGVATNTDTSEESKTILKGGQKNNKNPTSSRSPFQKARDKFERDARAFKEKPIEGVSKDQETGSKTVVDGQTPQKKSSDLFTTTATLTLKPAKKKDVKKQQIKAEPVSNTNFDDSESSKADKKRENVQVVSMLAHIEYNRKFGDFWEWNTNEGPDEKSSDLRERNLKDVKSVNANTENDWCILPKGVNFPVMSANQQYASNGENERIALKGNIFSKNLQTSDEKTANGHRHFPPLKHADSKAERTTPTDISENIFPCEEIEPKTSKTVCDRSSTCHCDSKMKNSIFSAICSTIENQFVSISSLLTSIPYMQTIISNGHYKKLSCNTCDENTSLRRTVNNVRNKTMTEKDDWILLPLNVSAYDDDGNGTSGGNRVSVGRGCSNVRELKQSIIVDKRRKNYLLIGGSISGQLRELSRNGFTKPYQICRSVIIRSRLKNFANSKQVCLPPFKILKRFKRNKIFMSRAAKRTEHELKNNKNLFSLLRIPEQVETLSNNKLCNKFVKVSKNEILGRNSKPEHDINNNDYNNSVCTNRSLTRSERVSNNFIVDEEKNNKQV